MRAAPPFQPRRAMTGPLLHGSGRLHIVDTYDVTSISDPDGALHRLVALADGSRTMNELRAALLSDYPQLDDDDVAEAVARLASTGILEVV